MRSSYLHDYQQPAPGSELYPLFLRTAPDNIVYLKYVLESYEGVGIVRTLNEQIAEIVVLATLDTLPMVKTIVESLRSEITLLEIPPPESMEGDWLLKEESEALLRVGKG